MKLAEAHPVPAVAAGDARPAQLVEQVAEDEEEEDEGGGDGADRHPVAAPRQVLPEQQQDDEGGGRYRRDEPGLLHAHAALPRRSTRNREPGTGNMGRPCSYHLSVSTSSTLAVALL